jgi:hypothetical protein
MVLMSVLTEGQTSHLEAPATMNAVISRVIEREHGLIKILSSRSPLVETYQQNFSPDSEFATVPLEDHYFLGRVEMGEADDRRDYLKEGILRRVLINNFRRLYQVQYYPSGFSSMAYPDRGGFDRDHYNFRFMRREFLGDVRCLLFDVTPRRGTGHGLAFGQI